MNWGEKKNNWNINQALEIDTGYFERDKKWKQKPIIRESIGKTLYELLSVFSEIDISEK